MRAHVDVVVVGGGIGGAALARALAAEGLGVTVLEASHQYEDRVRGESMHLWGVREARELGVEQVLLDAGAHVTPAWKQFAAGIGETGEIPMSMLLPGFDGTLNMRHPDACQALADAAASAGATVLRGVRDVKLGGGRPVSVSYTCAGARHELAADLVVGADGRGSTVRRQVGITMHRQPAISYLAGLLLDDVAADASHDVMATDGDLFFIMFHQGGGRARAYLAMGVSARERFAGRDSTSRFLEACRGFADLPIADAVAGATPAGPCATYPGDDTWTDRPFAEGVVLIGDAAGHNDPIIGQGLSIALRDARQVRDAVVDAGPTAVDLRAYGEERAERMRRVRLVADLIGAVRVEDCGNREARQAWFGERMAAMDPEVFPLMMGAFIGPETVPDELVHEGHLEAVRGA